MSNGEESGDERERERISFHIAFRHFNRLYLGRLRGLLAASWGFDIQHIGASGDLGWKRKRERGDVEHVRWGSHGSVFCSPSVHHQPGIIIILKIRTALTVDRKTDRQKEGREDEEETVWPQLTSSQGGWGKKEARKKLRTSQSYSQPRNRVHG